MYNTEGSEKLIFQIPVFNTDRKFKFGLNYKK